MSSISSIKNVNPKSKYQQNKPLISQSQNRLKSVQQKDSKFLVEVEPPVYLRRNEGKSHTKEAKKENINKALPNKSQGREIMTRQFHRYGGSSQDNYNTETYSNKGGNYSYYSSKYNKNKQNIEPSKTNILFNNMNKNKIMSTLKDKFNQHSFNNLTKNIKEKENEEGYYSKFKNNITESLKKQMNTNNRNNINKDYNNRSFQSNKEKNKALTLNNQSNRVKNLGRELTSGINERTKKKNYQVKIPYERFRTTTRENERNNEDYGINTILTEPTASDNYKYKETNTTKVKHRPRKAYNYSTYDNIK